MGTSPHDALFKATFEDPARVAELFRSRISPELQSAMDWSALVLEPGSFVGPELEDRHCDLLFSAPQLSTSAPKQTDASSTFFYLLLEHQSSSDVDMPLRMLVYMTRIWERHRKLHPRTPLPPVVPLVLSHAPAGWSPRTCFADMFSPEHRKLRALDEFRPDFSYLVDDLSAFSDADIRSRVESAFAQLALWLLRGSRDPERLLNELPRWAKAFSRAAQARTSGHSLHQLLRYVAHVCEDLHFERFCAKLIEIAPQTEEDTVTAAESFMAKGIERGIEQGIERGLRTTLVKQLTLKFGPLGARARQTIDAANRRQLECFLERVLVADSLAAVLAD